MGLQKGKHWSQLGRGVLCSRDSGFLSPEWEEPAGYQDTCSGRSEERTDGALSQGLPEKGHLHLDARDPVRALKGLEDSD